MPSYKLTYFNYTGLAEPIRFLLHQCGIQFEDERIALEDWPQIKTQMPVEQLPVLEVDDKVLYQSKAISRFLAKQNNLYGTDDFEAYEIDAIVDTIDDLTLACTKYKWEKDPALKAKLKEAALPKLTVCLDKFNEQVKENGGHFVGGKLTWADLLWAATTELLSDYMETELNKDHPELQKLVEKVRAIPNIKSYLANRPKSEF
ncbi:glutathione S-transferase-like [Augochlora pura]